MTGATNLVPFPPRTRLELALSLAADGFHVFPILPDATKQPPKGMHFKEQATRDAETIRGWFANGDYGVAVYIGRFGNSEALIGVDIDVKAGKPGRQSILALELEGFDLPDTRTHTTLTGGVHHLYRVPKAVGQKAVLGPGIDVRSEGGYLACSIGDRLYDCPAGEVAPAPDWLLQRCTAADDRRPDNSGAGQSPCLGAALQYIKHAPLAVEGQNGDGTTFAVAARLKDFDLSADMAFDLMAAEWNDRCSPAWELPDLRRKVTNAYNYGREEPGVADPRREFTVWVNDDPAPAAPSTPRKLGNLFFELYADVIPDIDRRALVEGLLDHGAMSVLYGDSNSGKTFVALGLGFSIATGGNWHGRKVEPGGVVYIAAEAGSNVKKRVAALRKRHGVGSAPFALVPCPVDLGGAGADVEPLLALIAQAEKAMGCPVKFIVIDTLSRAMGGGEENASKDMTAFVANVDRIRNGTKSHVMVVHHSGKNQALGARGHSSLRAATDTELEVANLTISATKQRDMDAGPPLGFALETVVIGQNADGMPVTSCVAVPAAVPAKPVKLTAAAEKALLVLQDMTLNGGKVPVETWREEFVAEHYENRKSGLNIFSRGQQRLVRLGIVRVDGEMAWPAENELVATSGNTSKS